MRLALSELRRRPGQFISAAGALTLLVVLMLFLGWLLDGLYLGSTGAIRAQGADAIVFSDDARSSPLRSSVDDAELETIAGLDGVASVSGVGVSLLGAEIPGEDEIANVVVAGYELESDVLPEPAPPGAAWADRTLEALGAQVGDVLLVGPDESQLRIVGWVDDTNYLLQNSLWVEPTTWRQIQNANRPDEIVRPGEFQIAAVNADRGADAGDVRAAIDDVLDTDTLSERDAALAVPGVPEQNATIGATLVATALVVALVVALFFALLTLERSGIYALLKALGVRDRALVVGLITQALLVAVAAFVVGGVLALALGASVPPDVPLEVSFSRALFVLLAVVIAALVGSLVSLRRVSRVDPASAIGAGA